MAGLDAGRNKSMRDHMWGRDGERVCRERQLELRAMVGKCGNLVQLRLLGIYEDEPSGDC